MKNTEHQTIDCKGLFVAITLIGIFYIVGKFLEQPIIGFFSLVFVYLCIVIMYLTQTRGNVLFSFLIVGIYDLMFIGFLVILSYFFTFSLTKHESLYICIFISLLSIFHYLFIGNNFEKLINKPLRIQELQIFIASSPILVALYLNSGIFLSAPFGAFNLKNN